MVFCRSRAARAETKDFALDAQRFRHPPKRIAAFGTLDRLVGGSKALIEARQYHQDLGQAGEEYGVKGFRLGLLQIFEPGAKLPLRSHRVTLLRRELPFKA